MNGSVAAADVECSKSNSWHDALGAGEGDSVKRSVFLPVYNEEGTVDRSIGAVSEEVAEWPDQEILICDNASTDRTVAIVKELGEPDPRLRIVPAERNSLYSWNVGRGIGAASGGRMFLLDGDCQFPRQ